MRVAIYARRSTEEHQVASLDVQVEEAHRWIAARGWTLDPAHVYIDDAISRAEFKKRPGLLALLNAAETRAFDVVITRDETRLGGDTYVTVRAPTWWPTSRRPSCWGRDGEDGWARPGVLGEDGSGVRGKRGDASGVRAAEGVLCGRASPVAPEAAA